MYGSKKNGIGTESLGQAASRRGVLRGSRNWPARFSLFCVVGVASRRPA